MYRISKADPKSLSEGPSLIIQYKRGSHYLLSNTTCFILIQRSYHELTDSSITSWLSFFPAPYSPHRNDMPWWHGLYLFICFPIISLEQIRAWPKAHIQLIFIGSKIEFGCKREIGVRKAYRFPVPEAQIEFGHVIPWCCKHWNSRESGVE